MPKHHEGVAPYQEEAKEPDRLVYTEDELKYRSFLIKRMMGAKQARDQEHTEFDDMDFTTYYETNAKAANSYIRPKVNEEDTRVVTGTTREKEQTIASMLLNFNFQPTITAYDENDQVVFELGDIIGDLVKKSRELEEYEQHRALMYKELLDQGTCFVEEQWVESSHVEKVLKKQDWRGGVKFKDIKWDESVVKNPGKCEVNLLSGTRVFLGNIKEFFIHKQPFLFTAERITWEQAKMLYGDWERWEHVPKRVAYFAEVPLEAGDSSYRNWTLYETEEGQVEVVKYQDTWANEYMVMLNGVMMLPPGFPLSAVSPSNEYTIAKGDSEMISRFFAYSKAFPAKTKVDQEVLDEFLKLFILKTQKSLKPPLVNNTGRVISKDVFLAGKIVSGFDPEKLKPIGDVQGVNQAEFALYELVKRIIDEKTVSPSIEGQSSSGDQTATEILKMRQSTMAKLGYALVGVIALETRLAWLRVHNIVQNWTAPVDQRVTDVQKKLKDVYRTVSIDTQLPDGRDGTRMVEFNDELAGRMSSEQMLTIDDYLSKREGRTIRKVYLSPTLLRKLKYRWHITITPVEKDSSELKRATYLKNLSDAMQIFGPQSLNMPYHKGRYATISGEDPEQFFLTEGQQSPMMGQQQPGGVQQNAIQRQVAEGVAAPNRQPSLRDLALTT